MNTALAQSNPGGRTRVLLTFALAHALEDQGDHVRAFDALTTANKLQRRTTPWNAATEHARVEAIERVFAESIDVAADARAGTQVIFIASLPRSGASLIEQILASHRDVAGANEITTLQELISREAHRRQRPFPLWVPGTTAPDWQRLGAQYLARTAAWREHKPRFTDKNLLNWLFVGVALSMLPSAKVVIVRRDPVETCLACYRQWFAHGSQFTCDLDDMADRYADFWHLRRFWICKYPHNVMDLEYEAPLAAPEATIRRLLDLCGLPFDASCLAFHRTDRAVLARRKSASHFIAVPREPPITARTWIACATACVPPDYRRGDKLASRPPRCPAWQRPPHGLQVSSLARASHSL